MQLTKPSWWDGLGLLVVTVGLAYTVATRDKLGLVIASAA
jgi:hypothetical protein